MKSPRLALLRNQIMQFRLPFLIFLLFWIAGFITFYFLETNKGFLNILMISICVFESENPFYNFYQFLWPLLFELLILTFILSTLQEFYGYNPEMKARKIASHKKNHTVVLGFNHLGERIVDFLRENKRPYSLVDIEMDKVENLINLNQPVVLGDYTQEEIIEQSGIKKCKEVFCVTRNLRRALIAAEKVRELNTECDLYMRVFNEHFRNYLTCEPWNAFTFSTSKWAMKSVKKWSKMIFENDEIIVLGDDTLVERIVDHLGRELKAKVYLIDTEVNPEIYTDLPNVYPYNDKIQYIRNLEEKFDMKKIKQIYICWNQKDLFSDAIILTVAIKQKYPHIQLFVRMFDEELAEIAKTIGVTTFSTSAFAFEMLQKEVKWNSGIHPRFKKKEKTLLEKLKR